MVVSVLGRPAGHPDDDPAAPGVHRRSTASQPGTLMYPEGTACAECSCRARRAAAAAETVFIGFGIAFVHKFLTEAHAPARRRRCSVPLSFVNRSAVFAGEYASELLGVGYIIGRRTASIMMAGAVLGYLVIIPLIAYVGDYVTGAVPPGDKPISEMSTKELRDNYLLVHRRRLRGHRRHHQHVPHPADDRPLDRRGLGQRRRRGRSARSNSPCAAPRTTCR